MEIATTIVTDKEALHGRRPLTSSVVFGKGAEKKLDRAIRRAKRRVEPKLKKQPATKLFQDFADERDMWKNTQGPSVVNEGEIRRKRTDLGRNGRFFRLTDMTLNTPQDLCSLNCKHNSIIRNDLTQRTEPCMSAQELRSLQNVMRPHTTGRSYKLKSAMPWLREYDGSSSSSDSPVVNVPIRDAYEVKSEKLVLKNVKDFVHWVRNKCSGSVKKAFQFIDAYGVGSVTKRDFVASMVRGNFTGDISALFDLLDINGDGKITVGEMQNLAPYFTKMIRQISDARLEFQDAEMEETSLEKPSQKTMTIARTCTIWLFRNAEPNKCEEKMLLLKHPPRDLPHLYELCGKVCSSLTGKVVALYNANLRRIKSPYELVHNGKYVVNGGEPLEPPAAFWDFTPTPHVKAGLRKSAISAERIGERHMTRLKKIGNSAERVGERSMKTLDLRTQPRLLDVNPSETRAELRSKSSNLDISSNTGPRLV